MRPELAALAALGIAATVGIVLGGLYFVALRFVDMVDEAFTAAEERRDV